MKARELGNRIILASHNPGKVEEIAELLKPLNIIVLPAAALGLHEPEETGASFEENALIKAKAATTAAGLPALADDSGLSVAALGGEPGIYSARWAGPNRDFTVAMRNLEEKLQAAGALEPQERQAEFICALCLFLPGGARHLFKGQVSGTLVWPPRGGRGFGYDPVFRPHGYPETFGEMEPSAKHRMSHRAEAFRKFVDFVT